MKSFIFEQLTHSLTLINQSLSMFPLLFPPLGSPLQSNLTIIILGQQVQREMKFQIVMSIIGVGEG